MKDTFQSVRLGLVALLVGACVRVFGESPVISSFSQNGELVCTNLEVGTVAGVEWASTASGPWTNSWAGLSSVVVDSNGTMRVSVPMFYRVRGVPAPSGMALIPAGSFTMGNCMGSSEGDSDELPLHSVYVSAFYMDRYEVSKALWDEVYQWATNHGYSFDYSDSGQGKAANHPAHTMTWYDSVKWCNARSEKDGRIPAYYTDAGLITRYRSGQVSPYVNWGSGYRLPTEAEWEKAARGGASGQRFPWGNTITWSQANYYAYPLSVEPDYGYAYDVNPTEGNDPTFATGGYPYTSPVGYFSPNGYGLYDMAGNVWQWCWDWYSSSYYGSSPTSDPRGPSGPLSNRVLRGGGWYGGANDSRCANRNYYDPINALNNIGFRCVRGL